MSHFRDILIFRNDFFERVPNPTSLDRKLINSSNKSWQYFELTDSAFDIETYGDHDIYYNHEGYAFYCIPSSLYGQKMVYGWTIAKIDEYILTAKQLDRLLTLAIKTYKKHESTLRLEKKRPVMLRGIK